MVSFPKSTESDVVLREESSCWCLYSLRYSLIGACLCLLGCSSGISVTF